jgi:hypothetical protein
MSDTTFISGTVVTKEWLNDVNDFVYNDNTFNAKTYGAIGDGSNDDTAGFTAALVAAASGGVLLIPAGTYKVSSPLTLASNLKVVGQGNVTITSTVAGSHIFSGNSLTNVVIEGISFIGTGSATTSSISVGGYAATSSGLVTIASSTNVYIQKCKFSLFYNGVSVIASQRVRITDCYIYNWKLYGILGSLCSDFAYDHNHIIGCDQTGAVGAYGISATGNANGGTVQKACSISFNEIRDVTSWDGIMTHDCDGLRIVGNDIRNVRNGIDLGSVNATTSAKNVHVADNYIEATTTDTWAGAAAAHLAILFTGYSASVLSDTVSITNNIISGFYSMTGSPTFAGTSAHIGCTYSKYVNIQGNIIKNGGTVSGAPGIAIVGDCNVVSIDGNTLQGSFSSGAVRLASVIGTSATITGNTIVQTTTTDSAVYVTSSTLAALEVSGNVGNSSTPYAELTSTITFKSVNAGHIHYTGVYSIAGLANVTATTLADFTVPGVVAGDAVTITVPTTGLMLSGYCPGANLVRVTLFNATGSSLTVTDSVIIIDVVKNR